MGTKVKREQLALLDSFRWTDLAWILVLLLWAILPGQKLFPFSYSSYNLGIKAVEQSLDLNIGATPHGARAGFASEEAAAGTPTAEIMRDGRWGSQQCMQMYVDVVVAAQVVSMVSLASHAIPMQTAARHFHTFYQAFLGKPLSHAAEGLRESEQRVGASGDALPSKRGPPVDKANSHCLSYQSFAQRHAAAEAVSSAVVGAGRGHDSGAAASGNLGSTTAATKQGKGKGKARGRGTSERQLPKGFR